jgi:hypothetical protein
MLGCGVNSKNSIMKTTRNIHGIVLALAWHLVATLKACLKIMKRVAMAITFAIVFYLGTVFSHLNAWFMRATETVSPSPGEEGRGEGGLQTKIELSFKIFRPALKERMHPLKSTGTFSFRQCCLTLLFLLVLPVAVRAQFTYTTNGSSVTITGYTGPGGAIVIPNSTNGHTVTGIGTEAFQSPLVTSVAIPTSITNIGVEAFVGCPNLTNISVTTGSSSFSSINGVLFGQDNTLVEYPEGLPLTNGTYTIPYTVTSIGPYAFADCSRLTNMAVVNVTNIGEYAFTECTDLTSVAVTNTIGTETSIDPYAFAYCSRLTNVMVYNVNIEDFAFTECTSLTSITIPTPASFSFSYVKPTSVGVAAFTFCISLTNVVIGSSVTNIGGLAFAFCTNLTSVYFASNAPSDFGTAFYEDPAATVYYLPGTTGWGPTFGDAPTVGKTPASEFDYNTLDGSITILQYNGSSSVVVIPSTINGYAVTGIGGGAFEGDSPEGTRVTSIAIPNSVTNIEQYAFQNCTSLTNISVDAANLFYSSLNGVLFDKAQDTIIEYPEGLKNSTYIIPDSVTNIGQEAFEDCTSLTSIVIPGSITSIGAYAFSYSYSLTSAYFEGNAPPDLGNAFAADHATVYYLPGTTGWGATFGGVPAVLWNPQATAFTTAGGQFGFNLTGPTNATIVVQACTNLANPVWIPVSTNLLTGGSSSFNDPSWAGYSSRFYRFTAQ